MSKTYIVNARDSEGRDLHPGLSFPPARLVPVGKTVEADALPKGSVKSLIRRGVISPAEPQEG